MKNVLRGSLLTFGVIGMLSFQQINTEPEIENCDDSAAETYHTVLNCGGEQFDATQAYLDTFWNCMDNGGESSFTANP
jgi:hypothetical protein